MKAHKVKTGISAAIALAWLAAGGAAGLASAPAASAAVHHAPRLPRVHVSPSGMGAARSAHHASRHAAARATTTTGTTEWVSNQTTVGNDTSCASPGFNTITDAINAAGSSDDTIKVCTGTYDEQLIIQNSVTLQAKGTVTVVAPTTPASPTSCDQDGGAGTPNEDQVDICGPSTLPNISVTVTGITFQGNWGSPCYDEIYGVAVLGGAKLTMSNSTVEDVGGSALTDGCQGGVGIQVGLSTGATTSDPGTATLTNDLVETYQKNGITVDGKGASATISKTTVNGVGPTNAIAQNGIQISDGAKAAITNSTVSGNECNVPNACGLNASQAAGILLYDAGTSSVSNTNISGNDLGIYNLQGFAQPFYTPPAGAPPLQVLSGLTLGNNRFENAYFDQGKAELTSSTVSGGAFGVQLAQYNGQTASAVGTVTADTITGTTSDAVQVASDQASGDFKVKLTATGDSFDTTNTGGGLDNQSFQVVTATHDWWGDATGPSGWSFGSGTSVSSDVNFFPWWRAASLTNAETCTKGTSETTTGNNVVLCAPGGTANSFLANSSSGNVLLIGNKGNDQLNGSSTGETWIIGGVGGSNVINGNNATAGFIQERGNTNNTLINDSNYTVAAS
jgi:hypothetical protein